MADIFRTKTRDERCEIMAGSDVCFALELSLGEAWEHPHMTHRGPFRAIVGVLQPAPAPRFSRSAAEITRREAATGEHTDEALSDWGFSAQRISKLRETGAIA